PRCAWILDIVNREVKDSLTISELIAFLENSDHLVAIWVVVARNPRLGHPEAMLVAFGGARRMARTPIIQGLHCAQDVVDPAVGVDGEAIQGDNRTRTGHRPADIRSSISLDFGRSDHNCSRILLLYAVEARHENPTSVLFGSA